MKLLILISFIFSILTLPINNTYTIIDFTGEPQQRWQVVNDGVMGGISQSTLIGHNGFAEFRGVVSLENNGGFASVRTMAPADLSAFEGIRITTKGDDKIYSIRIKTVVNNRLTPYAYEARFKSTSDDWTTVDLPFNSFKPSYRGFTPRNVPALNTSAVAQIGIMIKDSQEGPFSMNIQKIEAYSETISENRF